MNPFSDLPTIGETFEKLIKKIRDHHECRNMEDEARSWALNNAHSLLQQLKWELDTLRQNQNDPICLPEYALDPTGTLDLWSEKIPTALLPYRDHFICTLNHIFKSYGFTVHTFDTYGQIVVEISFSGRWQTETPLYIGVHVFGVEFEQDMLSRLRTVEIDL